MDPCWPISLEIWVPGRGGGPISNNLGPPSRYPYHHEYGAVGGGGQKY